MFRHCWPILFCYFNASIKLKTWQKCEENVSVTFTEWIIHILVPQWKLVDSHQINQNIGVGLKASKQKGDFYMTVSHPRPKIRPNYTRKAFDWSKIFSFARHYWINDEMMMSDPNHMACSAAEGIQRDFFSNPQADHHREGIILNRASISLVTQPRPAHSLVRSNRRGI